MREPEFPGTAENIYEYHTNFNYSVWTPNTQVNLCTVPWDSAYRDIVRFSSQEERDSYFESRFSSGYSITVKGLVYLRQGEPIRINVPFDMVQHCNYCVVRNQMQPVHPFTQTRQPDVFYYFVNRARYIAPNTTELDVQLDVWQTYYDHAVFNMCYVNRGHIAIANENSNTDNISDYLSDPEGLQYGDEYDIVHQEYINFQDAAENMIALVMSSATLRASFGTSSAPNLTTARGTTVNGISMGCEMYACRNLPALMVALQNAPWVSQCISLITYVPTKYVTMGESFTVGSATLYEIDDFAIPDEDFTITDVRKKFHIDQRYANLHKFYTTPYTRMEMTYQNGAVLDVKPECFYVNDEGSATVHTKACIMPPDIRIVAFFDRYNAAFEDGGVDYTWYTPTGTNSAQGHIAAGEGLDMALTISGFPQVALVNDMYQYYLASTTHQRAWGYASADWSQQKALAAASTAYSQATAGMTRDALNSNAQIAASQAVAANNAAQVTEANVNTVSGNAISTLGSIVAGGLTGAGVGGASGAAAGPVGVAGGALAGAVIGGVSSLMGSAGSGTANANLSAETIKANSSAAVQAMAQQQINSNQYSATVRDTNNDLATFAAQGDYQNAIQGIQAKVQDAVVTQPSTSGQLGGEMFNMANGYTGILIKWKRVKRNYMRQIGDYWLRYGYYVNRWLVPPGDLRCCENFTYWKMQAVSLGGDQIPELFRETIRGIFEKGVTVWTDPNKMYTVDLTENAPLPGVSY